MTDTIVRHEFDADEMARILGSIDATNHPTRGLVEALKTTFNILCEPEGLTWDDFGPDRPLNGSRYAIPDEQWKQIANALIEHAATHPVGTIGTVNVLLDWMNVGPASYSAVEGQ